MNLLLLNTLEQASAILPSCDLSIIILPLLDDLKKKMTKNKRTRGISSDNKEKPTKISSELGTTKRHRRGNQE